MPGGSGSECSTELEASGSVASVSASAADDQYEDDDFDDYSDSFESDGDEATVVFDPSRKLNTLRVGARVQVYWREENEWFDGTVQGVESNGSHYNVHYDDGEQQWEDASSVRPLPASTVQHDQLQQLLPLSKQTAAVIAGRRAIVFWPVEAEWYHGTVSAVQVSPPALKVEYDDGDSRWEQEHLFNCILLARPTANQPEAPSELVTSVPPPIPERILYARPYQQVISDHFQPVRIARPYRCAVEKHSESVMIPRRIYSVRSHNADRIIQATISSCTDSSSWSTGIQD